MMDSKSLDLRVVVITLLVMGASYNSIQTSAPRSMMDSISGGQIISKVYTSEELDGVLLNASDWMVSVQDSSGGFRETEGTDVTFLGTLNGLYSLKNVGIIAGNDTFDDAVQWVQDRKDPDGSYGSVSDTSRGLVVAVMADLQTDDTVEYLYDQQSADGSWGSYSSTVGALRSLIASGESPLNQSIRNGTSWVINNIGDVTATNERLMGMAVLLMSGFPSGFEPIGEQVDHFIDSQNTDGSWDSSTSKPKTTASIASGLMDAGVSKTDGGVISKALDYVIAEQNANGSWTDWDDNDGIMATARCVRLISKIHHGDWGYWGGAVELPIPLDLIPKSVEFRQGSEVVIRASAHGRGNISLEVHDPAGSPVYIYTKETDVDFNITFSFSVSIDEQMGTYWIVATWDNGSSVGQNFFDVNVTLEIPIKDIRIILNITSPDSVALGTDLIINYTIWSSVNYSVALVLQIMNNDNEALKPEIEAGIQLEHNLTMEESISIQIPEEGPTGDYSLQLQAFTILPSDGGYCLDWSDDSVEVVD